MRWGIIGAGGIAQQFANDSKELCSVELDSIFARDAEKAKAFAKKYNIAKAYSDFSDFIKQGDFDAVYIAVPHVSHKSYVLCCLRNGKHVLCEKPMGVNTREAFEMLNAARESQRLLMEGMWTRFFPAMKQLKEWIQHGVLGEIHHVKIDMGYDSVKLGEHLTWRFENKFAGGALLDLGIYAIYLALDIFNKEPLHAYGVARIEGGIDRCNSFILDFGGQFATITTTVVSDSNNSVTVYCEKGHVEIPAQWWCTDTITLSLSDGTIEKCHFPYGRGGMQYEIAAFETAVQSGLAQCPGASHDDSLAVVHIMDELRKSWGLVYPSDLD